MLWVLGYTLRMSVPHEKNSPKHFDNAAALRALQLAQQTLDIEAEAILGLKVCDPAVGSGHFLVGAAHRLARHLARVRAQAQGESEPSPLLYQHALRDVIGRCLYGVDLNPMAAELCRVSLWLEALEPGKPLSFLDHHIRVGNSLLGTTPKLIAGGLPDEAFNPIEGDDKKACTELKKRNRAEGKGLGSLFVAENAERAEALRSAAKAVDEMDDDTPERLARKAQTFAEAQNRYDYVAAKRLADAWCAAFVIRKHFPPLPHNPRFTDTKPFGITQGHLGDLAQGRDLPAELATEVESLARQYQFFHWHLAFPEVFARGGFDCTVGNPPWERLRMEETQFFASTHPEIATSNTTSRRRQIDRLKAEDPVLYGRWIEYCRETEAFSGFIRQSGRYPWTGKGKFNTAGLFAELFYNVLCQVGRAGLIAPTGVITDDAAKELFEALLDQRSLRRVLDFENRERLFQDIDSRYRFCLLVFAKKQDSASGFEAAFMLGNVDQTLVPDRLCHMTREQIHLVNPNSHTCPVVRNPGEFALLTTCYRRFPVLLPGDPPTNPWGAKPTYMFQMSDEGGAFAGIEDIRIGEAGSELAATHLRTGQEYVGLYEAKLVHQFDHRFATFANLSAADCKEGRARETGNEHESPFAIAVPRFFIPKMMFVDRMRSRPASGDWLISYREITNATNERTLISCVIPLLAAGRKLPQIYVNVGPVDAASLLATLNSIVLDFVARSKLSSTSISNSFLAQLPIPEPAFFRDKLAGFELSPWISRRVVELICTSWDLRAFACDCGWDGPPFRWDEERRFLIRCELDAAFFHLYLAADADGQWHPARKADGWSHDETPEELAELKRHFPTPRDAVAYIMDTFPIVRRKDEEKYNGDYRTKRVVLEIYDAMQEAIRTGQPYRTRLDPPPGPPLDADGKFIPFAQIADNPPPHIHLPRGAAAGGGVTLQLSDLPTRFPTEPFLLRLSTRGDAEALRVRPVRTADIQAPDRIVLASAKLRNAGMPVPAVVGKLRAEARTDASDGSAYVLVTVRGEDGTAQARFSEGEWRSLTTIGVVEDSAGS